jgi:hypothetical protein
MGGVDNAALLVMDMQNGVVDRIANASGALLETVGRASIAARAGVLGTMGDDPATRIHDALAPQPGDIIVTKRRVSAFAGSDLDVVLSSLDVDTAPGSRPRLRCDGLAGRLRRRRSRGPSRAAREGVPEASRGSRRC